MQPKILAFAGSARTGSFNKKLAAAAAHAARAAGAEVSLIDLRDFPMPLYDGDLEESQGLPENAIKLKEVMKAHHGLLIASPENNASLSALLKNTLDWASRPHGAERGVVPYQGKVAALLAASPGALGGLRGLAHLRAILQPLGVLLLSDQLAVGRAHEAFDDQGQLKDSQLQSAVTALAAKLVDVTRRMHG